MMNLLTFTLLFSILRPPTVNIDTTDWWHVWYNNKLITQYPVYPKNPPVIIQKGLRKDKDTLTVSYGNDTPCWNCTMGIYIFDTRKKKIILSSTKGQALFKLSVKNIINIMNSYHYSDTNVYYFDNRRNNLIFLLKIQ